MSTIKTNQLSNLAADFVIDVKEVQPVAEAYTSLGAYGAGLVFNSYTDTFTYAGGEYRPLTTLALPYTTTGVGAGEIASFRSVGDAVLRSDLAESSDPLLGSVLVGRAAIVVTSIAQMQAYAVPVGRSFSLNAGGRSGVFDVIAGDFSTDLLADTSNGIYVGLADNPTATTKVAKRRFSGAVFVEWFGAAADGTTNDTAAIQAAVDNWSLVKLSAADYSVTTIDIDTLTNISGVRISSGGGTRLLTSTNAAILVCASQGSSISDIAFVGDLTAGNTAQKGISITTLNNVLIENCFFSDLYDSIFIFGECFYIDIINCYFGNNIRAHVYAEGNTGPGNDIRVSGCRTVANSGKYGFLFKNYGSCMVINTAFSPNNLSENTILMDNPASAAGVQQFSNCVFEGSVGSAFRVIGAGAGSGQAKFFHFSNCYFGNSGTSPCISLTNTRAVQINGGYITNGASQPLVFLSGDCRDTTITDVEFQGAGKAILADTASAINGLYITNPSYASSQQFLDMNGSSSRAGVSVTGGIIGTNALPIEPAGTSGLIVLVPGDTKYSNEGIATFDGGASSFTIVTGLVRAPIRFSVLPNTIDAGTAEIREVTLSGNNLVVQCKAAAAAGTGNVKFAWLAE